MAANPDPSTTSPADPQPPSGNGSHPEPAADSTPVLTSLEKPIVSDPSTGPIKTKPVTRKKTTSLRKRVSGVIKRQWAALWKQKLRISISALSLLLTAIILAVILSIFSVSQVFPYTEWLMYRFKQHELALFFFCLLLVSGLCFVYTAQSLLKASLQGKSSHRSGDTAFNLHFGVVFVMVLISFLGLWVLSRISPCEVPYVTFQVEGVNKQLHNNEDVHLPLSEWKRVTAITDQDSYGRLICNWEKTEADAEISETQTCTIFVRYIGPGQGIVTLSAHMDVCNTPEKAFHLLVNGPE